MPTDTMIKSLSVELTPKEAALRGKELAEAMSRLDQLETDKKDFLDQWKEDVKAAESRVTELRGICMSGHEDRPIPCRIEKDFGRGVEETVRLDTGAVIKARVMTNEERQVSLPIPAPDQKVDAPAAEPSLPGRACEGCSMADGNHHPECTVAHGEPEEPVEPAPEQAEVKPDGTLVHHLRLPAAVQVRTRVGYDDAGNQHALTEEEAERFFAGKIVVVTREDGESVDIVSVAKPAQQPAAVVDGELVDEDDDPPPSSEDPAHDDYLEAAVIAEEQLATGAAPEIEAEAKLEEAKASDKKRGRGRPKGV